MALRFIQKEHTPEACENRRVKSGRRFFCSRCLSSSGVLIFLYSVSLFWWGSYFFAVGVSLLVGQLFFCSRCLSSSGVSIFLQSVSLF